MKRTKLFFPLAAVLLFLGSFSCTREDNDFVSDDVVTGNHADKNEMKDDALPPKESAIQKHIADHQKERTRSGALVTLEPVIYEGDTVI